jgi:pyrroline-5-carboxylate reductase
MNTPTIGFIGGGRITRIFLEGWTRARQLPLGIIVSVPDPEILSVLKSRFPDVLTTPDNSLAASQDLVFLAVHPPLVAEVSAGVRAHLKPDATVVSLATKFTIAKLTELLGGFNRLARVIPNAPSIVNAGYNPVAFGSALGIPEKVLLTRLFASLGEFPEVAEDKLEAYAVLTAMGPTYLWFQWQTLRELADNFGLSDEEVTPALTQMVGGALQTLLEAGMSPAEVMNLIPVKPLAAMEPQVVEAYRSTLPAIYQKIKP